MSTFEPKGNTRALVLATLAFTVSFYAWSMLGPLGPDLQDSLGLSELQLAVVVATPVLMGSLMRIPLGMLTDILGGRAVFTGLMAFTLVPLTALALWHASFASVVVFGFFLGFAGASFAVGIPYISRWYPRSRQGAALGTTEPAWAAPSSPASRRRASPTAGASRPPSSSPSLWSP